MTPRHNLDEGGGSSGEQLSTLGVCGAIGSVLILSWYQERLSFLHPDLRLPLALSGLALVVLVVLRILSVWSRHQPRRRGPWRCAVLLIPIMFFCLHWPQAGLANVPIDNAGSGGFMPKRVRDRGPLAETVRYTDLLRMANAPDWHAEWEGKTVTLHGRLIVTETSELSLVRVVTPCCAHHLFVVRVPVVIEPTGVRVQKLPGLFARGGQVPWVRVTGQIQFRIPRTDRDALPVLVLVVRPDDKRPLHTLMTELPANEERPAYEFPESP